MPDAANGSTPRVRRFWDERARQYADGFDKQSGDAHALHARLRAVIRLVGPGTGRALDAGMGPGRLCAALEAEGWTVYGIDASAEMVSIARRQFPDAVDRMLWGEIESLPFPDASFQRVTATGVLEYAVVRSALRELSRVLQPAGVAVVSYPNPQALYHLWKTRLYYPLLRRVRRTRGTNPEAPRGSGAITPESFLSLLQQVGLEPVSHEHTSVQPLIAPFDQLFPKLTFVLAKHLEGRSRGGSWLRTQIVYAARKPT
jgi:ubiquinone/menaquinone biosynthesis C-methylase UbiE